MKLIYSLLASSFLFAATSFGADGKALYTAKLCNTCHGPVKGAKPIAPNYPKLCGQSETYLVEQFKYIKSGQRATPLAGAMKAMVMAVTDAESQAIAKYLSTACSIK